MQEILSNETEFFYCSLLVLQGYTLKFSGKFIVFRWTVLCYSAVHNGTASATVGFKICRKNYPIFKKIRSFYIQGHVTYLCISLPETFQYISVYKRSSAGEHLIALLKTTEGFIVWKLHSLRSCGTFQAPPLRLSACNFSQVACNILYEF